MTAAFCLLIARDGHIRAVNAESVANKNRAAACSNLERSFTALTYPLVVVRGGAVRLEPKVVYVKRLTALRDTLEQKAVDSLDCEDFGVADADDRAAVKRAEINRALAFDATVRPAVKKKVTPQQLHQSTGTPAAVAPAETSSSSGSSSGDSSGGGRRRPSAGGGIVVIPGQPSGGGSGTSETPLVPDNGLICTKPVDIPGLVHVPPVC